MVETRVCRIHPRLGRGIRKPTVSTVGTRARRRPSAPGTEQTDRSLLWRSPSQQDQGAAHLAHQLLFYHLGLRVKEAQVKEAIDLLIALSECDEVGHGPLRARKGHRSRRQDGAGNPHAGRPARIRRQFLVDHHFLPGRETARPFDKLRAGSGAPGTRRIARVPIAGIAVTFVPLN